MLSGIFAFIGRIMLSLIFITSGVLKLADPVTTGRYMETAGLPANLATAAGVFELVAGIAVALGIFTRFWALLLAAFSLLTALMFHRETADAVQAAMALKNVAIAGGFLCLFAYEGKSWSLDHYRARRRDEAERRATVHPAVGAG